MTLCIVCGQGVTLPHQSWCERVRAFNRETNRRARKPRPPCTVDGCSKPNHARGLCSTHYQRWRRG